MTIRGGSRSGNGENGLLIEPGAGFIMNQGQIADNLYGGGIGAVEYGAQLLRLYLPLILW